MRHVLASVAAAVVGAAALASAPGAAHGYEFEIDARAVGQGYQLRWFRFDEADRLLNRRRFTQLLRLSITDILAPPAEPGDPDPRSSAPFELYFASSMRFDHDFGGFAQGTTTYLITETMSTEEDARTAVPELQNAHLELDVLYAYVGARDVGGFLDVELGRQLGVHDLDWFSFDGLTVHARTPWFFAIEALGGLVVRDSSPVASPAKEPDGTSSAHCFVFDPDLGAWGPPPNFEERCDQRDALMPTAGVAIETLGIPGFSTRLAYRRAWSSTPDGVYPDGAPSTGVNGEHLTWTAHARKGGGLSAWAGVRWSFLVGGIDEANAGVRLAWAQQAITPEIVYSFPTFDGDSIFNVFSIEPYTDARLTWDVWPRRSRFRAYARAFVRRFEPTGEDADGVDTIAAGGGIGGRYVAGPGRRIRLDLFYEDGFGGLRAGGDGSLRWRLADYLELDARVTVIRFDQDLLAMDGVTFGAQGGFVWKLGDGMALHLLAEENVNRFHPGQFRLIGVLDLAFRPEI